MKTLEDVMQDAVERIFEYFPDDSAHMFMLECMREKHDRIVANYSRYTYWHSAEPHYRLTFYKRVINYYIKHTGDFSLTAPWTSSILSWKKFPEYREQYLKNVFDVRKQTDFGVSDIIRGKDGFILFCQKEQEWAQDTLFIFDNGNVIWTQNRDTQTFQITTFMDLLQIFKKLHDHYAVPKTPQELWASWNSAWEQTGRHIPKDRRVLEDRLISEKVLFHGGPVVTTTWRDENWSFLSSQHHPNYWDSQKLKKIQHSDFWFEYFHPEKISPYPTVCLNGSDSGGYYGDDSDDEFFVDTYINGVFEDHIDEFPPEIFTFLLSGDFRRLPASQKMANGSRIYKE